ncbi:unnamed protein product [Lactuca saligna]|uniref:Ubiquitin-like protease family profile domain-containing protein n=2 Tax=Lactuca saligna TaxID=75948 RepID=A0AA35VWK9_LACSI|nr:unnamed protein product [Lactuca saligna]
MRSTRSSSFKSKFKNTVETALNLEDDNDDYVAETEDQIHEEEHLNRERRSKKKLDKSVEQKTTPKPLNALILEREIKSKRQFDRVPIVKHFKNKGIAENVKEEKEDNVRKTNKEYPPGLRYLPTIMKCDNITAAVMGMSPEQKQAILRMGFGSILQVNITSYPGQLSYYLLDVYDADSKRLVLQNSVIEITEQTVHDMMGLPFGGEDINELPLCDKGNQILEEWRGQYSGDKFNGEEYLRRIQATTKDNLMFRLNFLTLFVNNFIESMLMGTNQIKVVRKLVLVEDFSKLNWCKYMLDCLGSRKKLWKRDDKSSYYSGPITLLILVYVYNMKYSIKIDKRLPFIGHINGAKLLEVQKLEISLGGFRRQFRDEHDDVDMVDETGAEEQQMLSFKRDFGDEEAYAAVIEHSYGVIVTEKSTMEVALKDGLLKFPHSVVLNEWMKKMNELFKGVFKGAGNQKVHEPACFNEVNMNDVGDGGEGNSSPIRGLILTEVNTEKDDNYTTPVDTTSLTMTQFHRLPGVNDEMIKLLEETELQVYKKKKQMSIISGDNLVGRNIGEAVDNAGGYDDNDKREKRIPKKAKVFNSPNIERIVKVGEKLSKDETWICNLVFASTRDDGDEIWDIGTGHLLHQGFAYQFNHGMFLHSKIIDCWAAFLNKMENYKDESSLSRFFFDTTIVTEDILNELKSEDMKCRLFATLLRIYTKKFDVKPSFRDVALVFFPIVDDGKYYLLIFDLKSSLYYIVDHVKRTGTLERKYGMIPNLVKKLFCNYLTSQHHPMAKTLTFKAARVMNISWLVEKAGTECGIYLMRHMETYMGEYEGRWECGLTGKMPADVSATIKLRIKYMARLLTSDFNKFKNMIVKDIEAFRKLDILEQDMLLRESAENRKKKRKTKGRR